MNDRLWKPLLLDGATATNLWQLGMPPMFGMHGVPKGSHGDGCPEEWILEHPMELEQLQLAFLKAGSRMLFTPTGAANSATLAHYGREEKMEEYNRRLARMTVDTCRRYDPQVLVAGCVAPLDIQAEPFGETPFMDLVNIYAHQAFALKDGGVDLLVADAMTSLSQCRAALLGCRQTGLPVMVTLNIEEDGETCLGCDLVSAQIVCQSLGAAAFGLSCCGKPSSVYRHLEEMAPYAAIPLIARPDAGSCLEDVLSPEEMAQEMVGLLERGATLVGGCCFTTPAHIQAFSSRMQAFDFASVHIQKEDPDTLFMASETEPYFLDEYFEQSDPIRCEMDMSDDLLALEETRFDVVTVQVDTVDDAYLFALNAHMIRKPVIFRSDSEEALEMALLLYNGRAFVDSESEIDEDTLRRIAQGYGAYLR